MGDRINLGKVVPTSYPRYSPVADDDDWYEPPLCEAGKKILRAEFFRTLRSSVDDECARMILESEDENGETFFNKAMEDFLEASDFQRGCKWNDDDIRLSIGRILKERLSI